MVMAEPMGSQLSLALYEELSQPYIQEIIRKLKKPCGSHICRKASHVVHKMAESEAGFLSIDDVDIESLAGTVRE